MSDEESWEKVSPIKSNEMEGKSGSPASSPAMDIPSPGKKPSPNPAAQPTNTLVDSDDDSGEYDYEEEEEDDDDEEGEGEGEGEEGGDVAMEEDEDPEAVALRNVEKAEGIKAEGNEYYKAGDYVKAAEFYSEAISLSPRDHKLLGNRSAALMQAGKDEDALRDALKSVDLEPSFTKGHLRAGKCYSRLGKMMEAKMSYTRALALEPHNRDAARELSTVARLASLLSEAQALSSSSPAQDRDLLRVSQEALDLSPSWAAMRTFRASAMLSLGVSPGTVSSEMSALLREDPGNAEALVIRGLALWQTGNVDQAERHLRQALQFAPDSVRAQRALKAVKAVERGKAEGNAAFRTGKHDEAVRLYSAALDRLASFSGGEAAGEARRVAVGPAAPANFAAMLFANRAAALCKLRRHADALADCTDALELDPGYAKALLRRCECHQAVGNFDDAVRDAERACELLPEDRNARQTLKDAKFALKKSKRKDLYKIIGVTESASTAQIKKAYKIAALKNHPDKHPADQRDAAEARFKEIGEAMAILSDDNKRALYDQGHDLEDIENGSAGFGGRGGGGGGGFGGGFSEEDIFSMFGGMGGMGGGRRGGGGGGFGGFGF